MNTQAEREILAAHADRLNAGLIGAVAYPPMLPEQQRALEPLLLLAEQLVKAMVPVEPSPIFVQKLGQELAQIATWSQLSLIQRYRRAIVFTVATLGSAVSLMLFYWFRQRDTTDHVPAALHIAKAP